jgi:hypothetical protein
MGKLDLGNYSSANLLALYANILDELQKRNIVHSTNNPAGNYAEKLAAETLGLTMQPESTKGFDAKDPKGVRYEIKGRRPTSKNHSRQLSALRDLTTKHFDYLIGIIFHEDFQILKACIIPHEIILQKSRFSTHSNSYIFILTDDIWQIAGVRDITQELIETQSHIG